jgi:tRNA(adenine34) deaminase
MLHLRGVIFCPLQKLRPMLSVYSDDYYMQQALAEARKALEAGEVPVGAVIVCENRIIARAHNQTEQLTDVTAHAEILAITAASSYLGSKYLPDCTLFVTLEPCLMCAGAITWAQIGRVVYGATDEKRGFMRVGGKALLHPKTKLEMGIRVEECSDILLAFFREKR